MTINILNILFIVVYLISCILIVYNIKLAFESCYTLIYVLKYDFVFCYK